jgi:hypothetical protein
MASGSTNQKKKQRSGSLLGVWIAIGTGARTALGLALGNIAIGVALGAGIGVAVGAALEQRRKKSDGAY